MRIQIGLLVMFSTVNLLVSMYCQGADDHRIVLEKGSVALAWAMEPKSSRIFCITKGSDQLIEYNGDGKQLAKHQIVKGADNLFIKKGIAVLSVTAERKLHFFDLKTNQLAGSLDIPKVKEPSQRDQHRYRDVFNKPIIPETKFTASRVDNNFVYVFAKNGRLDSGIFKIDISKKVFLGEINSTQPYLSGVLYAFEVSRDGKWAALRRSPESATPMQFNEGKFEVYPPEIARSVAELYAPFDWAAYSGKRTSINSGEFRRQFAVQFMAGFPSDDRKVLFSFSNGNFSIRRLKDNKTIFSLREEFSRFAPPTIHYMNVGEKSDFLFLGMSDRARWIDLRQYKKLMNGGVKIVVEKNYKFRLGEKIKFSPQFEYEEGVTKLIVKENGWMRSKQSNRSARPLNVADQSLRDNQSEDRISVINSGNSKIVGNHLLWNPGAQDVGSYRINIEVRDVKSDELLSSAITIFQLGAAEWKLGVIPETSALDKSGRYAVVWDRKNSTEQTQLRSLEVNLQEKIAEMTVDADVEAASITSKSIFVAVEGKSSILRYSHQFDDEQKIEIGFTADVIEQSDGSNLLFSNDSNVAIYNEVSGKFKKSQSPYQLTNVDQRLKIISEKRDIPSVFVDDLLVDKYQGDVNKKRHVPSRTAFKKPVSIEEIEKIRFLKLSKANKKGSPFAVELLSTRKQQPIGAKPSRWNVSLVSMSDGKTIAQIPFGSLDSYEPNLKLSPDNIKASLMLNRIVLKVGSKLCYQNIPDGVVDSLPIPPRFKENQCGEVTVGKIAIIPINSKKGPTNLSFRLLRKWPGLSIDRTNGQLTIDTNKVWNSYANSFLYDKTYSELLLKRRRPRQDFTFDSIAKGYQRVTGKRLPDELTAAKVWIEIEIDNTIEKRQVAYPLILIGPRSALLEKMNIQLANRAAFPFTPIDRDKQEEQERERQRWTPTLNPGIDSEVRQRVTELGKEINRSIQISLGKLTMSGNPKTDKKDTSQSEAGKEKSLDQLRQQLNQIEADLKAIRK